MKVDHLDQRRQFVSDAFHSLNQPLTGLHCGLEIALQKPRTDGEYRQRIGEGIENAGAILALVRAVRQLVESSDPGERFGTVSLSLLLSQLKNELEVISETTRVAFVVECPDDVGLMADPGKLMATLGGLIAGEMEGCESGAQIEVKAKTSKKHVVLTVEGTGQRKNASAEADDKAGKVVEIRKNAAYSYLWTVGGDFELTAKGLRIKLPVIEK